MIDFLYKLIIFPITQIIELSFTFSQKIFRDPGISLIVISSVISLICLPLYAVAEKWQEYERNLQKKFKPKISKIKSVFKGDEQYMILSTYYRQNHYHPVYALRSSFGLLVQIPFFVAAFSYLSNFQALQGAKFFFIKDLGRPDAIFSFGNGIVLNILPVIMTLINCAAGAVYTKGLAFRDKLQIYGMAGIFLVLLYNSPAGLVVYWTMNNCFSLLKNAYYKISFKKKTLAAFVVLTAFCILFALYILCIYRGDYNLRVCLIAILLAIAVIPWIVSLAKNFTAALPVIHIEKKSKFLLFFVSFASLAVITGLFLPSMLVAASPQEFSFIDSYSSPLSFIFNTTLQAVSIFIIWPFCLYFLFPEKIKTVFSIFGSFLLCSALCNIFLFSGNYGIISVDMIFTNGVKHNFMEMILNLVFLLIPLAGIWLLCFLNKTKIIVIAVSLCLFSILSLSFYNILLINKEYRAFQEFHSANTNELVSVEPIFELSRTEKNIVVIMLDRAHSAFLPYIFEENPELNADFSGFVYYPNTVSFNGYTRLGAPPIFGGYEYTPEGLNKRDTIPMLKKHNEALLLLPRIFSENGYSVTVADPPYPNYSSKEDLRIYDDYPSVNALITDAAYTKIWGKEHDLAVPSISTILKRNMFWYSMLKISPEVLRRGIYLKGDWCSPNLVQRITKMLDGYAVLDYLPKLTGITDEKKNTALIMVNNTTHENCFLQAPEYRPSFNVNNYGTGPFKKESAYHVNVAVLKRLGEWLLFLKHENVYDNTRIILVADHGPQSNYVSKLNLPFALDNFNPLLLVKDFNMEGSMKTDMTFMTNADVPCLALAGEIDNPVNPFTGNKITIDAKNHPQYISISGSIHIANPMTPKTEMVPEKDYYVHDNIFDPSNWEKVGK